MKKAIYLLPFIMACEDVSLPVEPAFSGLEVSALSPYTAQVHADLLRTGEQEIDDHGFAYGKDSTQLTLLPLGPLTSATALPRKLTAALTDLQAGSAYLLKGYVRINGKIQYSSGLTFTTPVPEGLDMRTGTATDISYAGARLQGIINHPGNLKITEYGLEWGLKSELEEPITRYSQAATGTTFPVTFQYFVGNLAPSTTYYFRTYLKAGSVSYYGTIQSFITGEHYFPRLQTGSFQTGETEATLHGSVERKGSHAVTEYGIVYATTELPTIQNHKLALQSSPQTYPAHFHFTLKNLLPATVYHYRTYATMNGLTAYGEDKYFTTGMEVPQITTLYASGLKIDGALLNARLEAQGTFAPTEIGVMWGHSKEAPLLKRKYQVFDIPTPFQYQVELQGLMDNQTYHYRAYVLTKGQMYYGELRTFTTLKATPISAKTSSKTTDLGINGIKVEADINPGSYKITEQGFHYAFEEGSVPEKIVVKKSGEGPYKIEAVLPSPGCSRTVYFRVYALGERGYTVHGEKLAVRTKAC